MPRPYDHHWAKVRLAILDRDHHLCQIRLAGCTTEADQVDHIVPLSEGGARLDASNLRASCRSCNMRRMAGRSAALVAALQATTEVTPSRKW